MRNLIVTTFVLFFLLITTSTTNAQMMMSGFTNSAADWDKVVEHTTKGEQEGKVLWNKLQSKQTQCVNLSDEDFDALGEYFMGTMMGDSHATMNAMMMQMHGEQGEEQIHITMGKRLSGCDTSAAIQSQSLGWMPMMQMMWGGWSSPLGSNSTNNSMMNYGGGWGMTGGAGLFGVTTWIVIIVDLVLAGIWLWKQIKK